MTDIDPQICAAEECVTRPLIEHWAREQPDQIYALFADGLHWTYRDLQRIVKQTAFGLQQLDVKQGDHVVSWLPNGHDALRVWFALNYIGAVYVPINTAYRGGLLAHVIENSDAELIIAHADLVDRLEDVDIAKLKKIVCVGGGEGTCNSIEIVSEEVLAPQGKVMLEPLDRPILPSDTQSIIYTSGTTGPSKGVLSSYLHLYTTGAVLPKLTGKDRYMVNLPLFHVGGTMPAHVMLAYGGSIAVIDSFNTQTFLETVRQTESTFVILLGVMAQFLIKQPANSDDHDSPLKTVVLVPLDFNPTEFSERFGVNTYTIFNMTEISCPIISELNPTLLHSAGKLRSGIQCRVVDKNDCEVPVGEIGQLIVRSDTPWTMNHGYNKSPEATAQAWRNGWFHTGDGFRQDNQGNYFFVDRIKDAIRRRGENISSYEVEAEVLAHPDINECAAVAVSSEVSEDEVMVIVAPVSGTKIDPQALIQFLVPRMAHFMIPRYIRILDELPKTPTQKVRKAELRDQGVTSDTWDRVVAGVSIKRDKLGK